MFRTILAFAAIITAAGCSENASDLTAKTKPITIDSPDNYQLVYRRLAKFYDCKDGAWAGAYASIQVDRELYTELGFGELALRMTNVGVNNYYHYIKVSKIDTGSRTIIYTGNTLAADKDRKILTEVATGERPPKCNAI